MEFVFAPPPVTSLAVRGMAARFPVRRVYCVGRNYAAHAIEMGFDPDREPPFFFQKNPDNLVPGGGDVPYPPLTQDLHHEIELVAALGEGGRDIPRDRALDHVFGYAVGIDLTRRDLQGVCKKMGRPWEVGKAFEHSAPCSEIVPAAEIGHPDAGDIHLDVNGARRQEGDLNQLIWKLPEVIEHLSGLFTLAAGDLIFTGTPAGVGPVVAGDTLTGSVAGVGGIAVRIV
ncbi:MAG: fumarylacetoacetate hydrolase family protein [Hyphomicrobiales bacterium]|nr:fumarylacetoacetate hydrolase family protein [Hyphomicrobiales bacterium]